MKVEICVLILLGISFIYVLARSELQNTIPTIKTTKPGSGVKFTCFKPKETEYKLIWFFRKNNHSDYDRVSVNGRSFEHQSTINEEILILNNPTYSNEGFYTLKSVADVHIACSWYLEILSAPKAMCKPSLNMPVDRGSDVTLTCTASRGNPAPTTTWFRLKDRTINSAKTHLVNTSTITIQSVTEYASGLYECRLYNDMGDDSCQINVNVKFQPKIELYETKISLKAIQNTTLMCRVTANPMSRVVWTRDNITEQLYANSKYDIKEDTELLATHYTKYITLTLNAVELKTNIFGVYWCRITGYDNKYARKVEVILDDT